jgi:Xaa-Pro aminopeptidase
MKTPGMKSRLIIGSSEQDADLLYATKFFVPDDFIWLEHGGKSFAVMSPLEIDRAKRTARVDEVLSLAELETPLQKKLGRKPKTVEIVAALLKSKKIRTVEVHERFPSGYLEGLRTLGVRVNVSPQPFFPQRSIKTPREILQVERGLRLAEAGMARAFEILGEASVDSKKFIIWQRGRLTSEILRGEIDAAIIKLGGLPARTIVAGGIQACDPHEGGSGPLRAGQAIILDIFPRDQRSGYFGDLTRTVVKGQAGAKLKHLYATVQEGKQIALGLMRPGADGKVIHDAITHYFAERGYPTEIRKGRWVGFFHGTGHSLGLEIHEAPRFSASHFPVGEMMTVEPGLYIPGIGGVRLEDLVVMTARGPKNLTRVKEELEIP